MKSLIPRDERLALLTKIEDPGLVRVITGVRRCGKSALLALYRNYLIETGVDPARICVINFEDAANDHLRDPQRFHDHVLALKSELGITHLHVDEVQELQDWARIINSLRLPEDVEICITGSNASMFAGESMTYLAGRYIELHLLPLSLAEFRHFRKGSDSRLEESYQEWMEIGGFPASALSTDERVILQLNQSLFDSIFTRDIALRGQVRDTTAFIRVAQFVFDNAGSQLSVNSIVGQLKAEGMAVSADVVSRYLQLMVDAHLVYHCRRYDTKGKKWLRTKGKYYFVDPGLRNALLGSRPFNYGHDLENMVFLELTRRGYRVSIGAVAQGEIDFVATLGRKSYYIQVSYLTDSKETLDRELAPFSKLPAGARCVLISLDRIPPATGEVDWVDGLSFLAGGPLP